MRIAFVLLVAFLIPAGAAAQQPRWEELGPSAIGGRVTALAVDPSNASHWLAGTPGGGLWQTLDAGVTWAPQTLWLATVPISALAIDPADSNRILVGTGALGDGDVHGGIGLLGTRDGGATWAVEDTGSAGALISTIVVWPGDTQRVLVGTDLGIRLSLNGGTTYGPVLDGQAVSMIVIDPHHADRVLASCRSGLWSSADRGASWTLLAAWPLLSTDEYGAGVTAIALSSSTPDLVYATVQVLGTFNQTARALVLRSADGGHSFATRLSPDGFCPGTQSCGFAHAVMVGANDNALLIGGERLSRSLDGGQSWIDVGGATGIHLLTVAGGATVAAGRTGTATLDSGWTVAVRRNQGLAITGINSLDLSNEASPKVLAGTADAGTVMLDAPASPWRVIFGADSPAGVARFDPFDASRMLASYRSGGLYRSADGGATFVSAQAGLDMSQPAAALAPVEPSPLERDVWYTGRLQTYSSANGAVAWGAYRPPGFPEIGVIASSPVVAGRLYFGTLLGGSLYKTDLSTTDTDRLVVADDAQLRITSLFLDPNAQNVMYAAGLNTTDQGGRVFKSADFGLSWTNITPSLFAPASSIMKDRYGALYVGTRDGVWRSGNDGYSWTKYIAGLFAGGVTALKAGGGWIYAGTSGRGVFRIQELPLISIESTPPGVRFVIDGVEQPGPFLAYWEPGSTHTIAPVSQNTATVREEFLGWADGGAASRTLTATGAGNWLMAGFKRSFKLSGVGTPAAGGSVEFAPASVDGFYPERSFVKVIPVPAPDHRITSFSGDLSGNDGLIAYAFMDRARAVAATFEPLRMTIKSEPSAVDVLIDGATVTTPATYQWADSSTHALSAPAIVGSGLYNPVLAFDAWTDLRARTHTVSVTRDTFMTDVTAKYISTIRGVEVPAGGARTLTTPGIADAPRFAGMRLTADGGTALPAMLQFVRGSVGGIITQELAVVPGAPRTWTNVFVAQDSDGAAGRIRLALFNPGTTPITAGILLRASTGDVQAAAPQAVTVPAGGHVTAWLDDLMQLPTSFKSLLTLIATDSLVTTVYSIHGNWRPTNVLDPILLAPFVAGDYGVSADPRVQVVMRTPGTTHDLVLFNSGFSALAGIVTFLDETGVPVALDLPTGSASSVSYSLPPGGSRELTFTTPASAPAGSTLQVRIAPSAGQPAASVQLIDEQLVGSVNGSPTILPSTTPPSVATRTFTVPIDRTLREAGVVLTNTSALTVTASVRLRDRDGAVMASNTIVVAAGRQLTVAGVMPGIAPDFSGELTIDTDIPVHGVGYLQLTNARGETITAGFPAVTDQPALGLSSFAIDGDSWRSSWWFINRNAAMTRTLLDFRGVNAATVYFPVQ